MATVKYETVIDAMWDQWTKGLENIAEGNKQVELWTLKTLEQQQEFVSKAVEQLQEVDKQWKAELENLQKRTVENLRKTAGNAVADSYEEWTNRMSEALSKLQSLSVNQSKTGYTMVKQAQEQYHQVITQLLEEQKKTREELQQVSDAYVEQVKSLQKSFAQSVDQYAVVK
ncbi:polyhydroxyalkanoic acid inclusion protein PhaP [Priestia flexa]|jgi:polyhydroxyalkanoic acid inclusion protein PhaP|uniref:Poly (3-hydroxybutyrate) depolymerase n=2 Tax=Priestia TaxID=2800373 RepID=A0A0V8JM61_9BACI|nr:MULTISPECIES: polyhydroxyalkanoic acid inclusion protein PhaP [Bacillaceae]AQX55459.1 polyhydroxyalkanoic acid inclusion protein PhaP [Priestia flexa]KSU88117.1 poly (3-hydroxybutyrate) depolymerase [Priestia veravalensis]KZB90868.1 poly(3-hydroxybutyrate) depolymerase [Bacillus sp. VT 712]MBN8252584.1 polyhydroxyalkanoic acid inclusion protein PhaP [Priestia flexa]MBN8434053.1 polyhydroxyalkanoic acid inclusion protein PhaP [Priestia flexa]